jgi:hypothetical protein
MKKTIAIIAVLLFVFTGCMQAAPQEDAVMGDENVLTESMPEDYQGSWLRTAVYVDGALQNQTPAILTLNKTDYTSVGTCSNSGKLIDNGENSITLTLDSTDCPGVSAGGSVTYTYTIEFDKENNVEVMTTVTGPVTETYNRQS